MRTTRTSVRLRLSPMLLAAMLAGCSFSWDGSGISNVLFGGTAPAEIVPGAATNADSAADGTATNADAAKPAAQAAAEASESLRKVAVLPVAYSDGAGGIACDLCPPSVQMKPTGRTSARLATGFLYEAIARHPRILFPTPDAVEKAMAATPGRSMRATAAALAAAGRADMVVAAALIELRPRVGNDQEPEQTAGAAIYASLVNARTGEVVWSDTFDANESRRGVVLRSYDKIINDQPIRYRTAEGYSEYAIDELVEDLVDELD